MIKKVFNIFISAILTLTLLLPITVSAEENINIYEAYTFEEFLQLSKEEICAISDEVSEAYAFYQDNSSDAANAFILHVVIDESYKNSNMAELFMYPDDMITAGYECEAYIDSDDAVYAEYTFNFEKYLINSGSYYDEHLRSAITAWFYLNPISLLCTIETPVSPDILPSVGDIDQNGTIDISDATEALTIYANTAAGISVENYTEQQRINADVNGDSIIDISDATAILTYYAQNTAGLQPDWQKILD